MPLGLLLMLLPLFAWADATKVETWGTAIDQPGFYHHVNAGQVHFGGEVVKASCSTQAARISIAQAPLGAAYFLDIGLDDCDLAVSSLAQTTLNVRHAGPIAALGGASGLVPWRQVNDLATPAAQEAATDERNHLVRFRIVPSTGKARATNAASRDLALLFVTYP